MAELALNAGVRFISAAATQYATTRISQSFAPDRETGPRYSELSVQTSTEGAGIPLVHGRMRVTGQVIWASRFKETKREERIGGKGGGPITTSYAYSVSFAVGLAEGPIARVGRVWANGTELDLPRTAMRVHQGGEDQTPDPLIAAIEGEGAPAYRGLAYAVFEDFPLDEYGARIPNLAFEVYGASADEGMEARIEGVCLIPASGEFAYADQPVFREEAPGREVAENVHTGRAETDLEAALDDLQAGLPQCRSVALVTAWFGTDLRCGACEVRPGVERRGKLTRPLVWEAAGQTRATAHLISGGPDVPAYGGAPSDETVIAAIRAIRARGMTVVLYPFILMDVPPGNALPDPYGGTEQAAYPWRGRITCHPAAGQAGSPDGTAAAAAQVADFFGEASAGDFAVSGERVDYSGPEDWRFSRFILHHAALAKAAGGVDAFLAGSEMRGLTAIRDDQGFPAVERLRALAGEVRALLGPDCQLSYAADWSEYSGVQPGGGDRLFHLDPLWADPEIDFVGIDWYAPLSDWRDGRAHIDALAGAGSIHDRDYLRGNVEGGEGFDWFYASDADRLAQTRTPITDGQGEPWIWRYKDLRSWWSEPHHDRVGGARATEPTAWVPQSKPIAFIELGCPAVDKGANQPNVFLDPKSSESFAPYFSSGRRDDLIQRRWIEVLLDYWSETNGRNPVSELYGGPMLDLSLSHVWTWDARPFPEFPALDSVWADGANWRTGHWLTGRAGQNALGRVVADLAAQAGLERLDVSGLEGVLAGHVIDRPISARAAIERLGALYGFDVVDRADGPAAVMRGGAAGMVIAPERAVRADGAAPVEYTRAAEAERPREMRAGFVSDSGDYRAGQARALGLDERADGRIALNAPVLADFATAEGWARAALERAHAETRGASLSLPPSLARIEPGDGVQISGQAGEWRLTAGEGLSVRAASLSGAAPAAPTLAGPEPGASGEAPPGGARPVLVLMDLPLSPEEGEARGGLWAVAFADPWPGALTLWAGPDRESAVERAEIADPAVMGVLDAPLESGPEGRWDRAGVLSVSLYGGGLESRSAPAVLGGANRMAIQTDDGWEVIQFTDAELIGSELWRLTGLLRGLGGSPVSPVQAGARCVLLNGAGAVLSVSEAERGGNADDHRRVAGEASGRCGGANGGGGVCGRGPQAAFTGPPASSDRWRRRPPPALDPAFAAGGRGLGLWRGFAGRDAGGLSGRAAGCRRDGTGGVRDPSAEALAQRGGDERGFSARVGGCGLDGRSGFPSCWTRRDSESAVLTGIAALFQSRRIASYAPGCYQHAR